MAYRKKEVPVKEAKAGEPHNYFSAITHEPVNSKKSIIFKSLTLL